ncbi:MAG TPA: GNAT family N-acetyltransferase [Novosphingobium sp.]|nr:GNAT family N-acetyltransferase [Novosphingobium sp.]
MTLASGTDKLESERLVLRRITRDDLPFYSRIQADPDVARYIATGKPRSAEESLGWLEAVLASYASVGLGQLAVVRKADGVLVGRCGLSDSVVETDPAPGAVRRGWFFRAQAPEDVGTEPVPELGYTFAREHWGHGYASEAAACVHAYARAVLPVGKIMSVIHPDNHASVGVVRKYGVRLVEKIEMSTQQFDRYDWP